MGKKQRILAKMQRWVSIRKLRRFCLLLLAKFGVEKRGLALTHEEWQCPTVCQGKGCQPMETQRHLDFRAAPTSKSSGVLPASREKRFLYLKHVF